MTPDNKPEWFHLADADNAASTRKISKGLPIMALVAVAAIIGVGSLVAQPQDQSPAAVVSTQTSTQSESVAPLNNELPAATTTAAEAVAPQVPSSPGVTSPLAKKPQGGEYEDNDDKGGEYEDNDDKGDDKEEGEDD